MSVTVGNGGVITQGVNTVAELRSYSIDVTADTIETTIMGSDTRTYKKGMASWSGSADVYWDSTHWSTLGWNPAVTGTSEVGKAPVTIKFYPNETGSNWTGDVIITGYSVKGSMDGLIEATVSFQGSGPLGYA